MARRPPRPAGGPDDAVVPNGAAPCHHDQATFATTERREATRVPTPNRDLTNAHAPVAAPELLQQPRVATATTGAVITGAARSRRRAPGQMAKDRLDLGA
jgi:hypothetical protein